MDFHKLFLATLPTNTYSTTQNQRSLCYGCDPVADSPALSLGGLYSTDGCNQLRL